MSSVASKPGEPGRYGSHDVLAASDLELYSVADYQHETRERIPEAMFRTLFGDYGAVDWRANTENVDGYDRFYLRPRILRDLTNLNLSSSMLGEPVAMPIMVAPSGSHQRYCANGELATVEAAGEAGVLMALSTASSFSIEEVANARRGPLWFQLYVFRNRDISARLVERAARSGYSAIVATLDMPGIKSRERDYRYSWHIEAEPDSLPSMEPARVLVNLQDMGFADVPTQANFNEKLDAGFTWADLEWLRSLSDLPLIIKGVQTPEDAILCVEHGVEGIVVSNHGGFGINDGISTVETLAAITDVVGSRMEVYLDGGIRKGSDVLKALALGASGVFVGRAVIFGLIVNGAAGASHVLALLKEELRTAMMFCGVDDVRRVDSSLIGIR